MAMTGSRYPYARVFPRKHWLSRNIPKREKIELHNRILLNIIPIVLKRRLFASSHADPKSTQQARFDREGLIYGRAGGLGRLQV